MAGTPESKVKAALDRALYAAFPRIAKVNPIGGPFSEGGVSDKLYCVDGVFVAIEVKAEAPKPSALQLEFLFGVAQAGGIAICYGSQKFRVYYAGRLETGPHHNVELVGKLCELAEAIKARGFHGAL